MHFRPYPVLTLIAIPALALLIGLGVWQLQRAEWKAGLITDHQSAAATRPVAIEQALCRNGAVANSRRVLSGESVLRLLHQAVRTGDVTAASPKSLRVFGANRDGEAGWNMMTPVTVECVAGPIDPILFEFGFEPMPGGPSYEQAPVEPAGPEFVRVLDPDGPRFYLAPVPSKGAFAPSNNAAANEWHWFDLPAMATALSVPRLNSQYLIREFSDRLPENLARTPPETHIGYAVTWFGMAIAFLVIYALFHARAGRLRFGKRA
jgi:surfeit locus 1 family protein